MNLSLHQNTHQYEVEYRSQDQISGSRMKSGSCATDAQYAGLADACFHVLAIRCLSACPRSSDIEFCQDTRFTDLSRIAVVVCGHIPLGEASCSKCSMP